jgi:hypothetical protein
MNEGNHKLIIILEDSGGLQRTSKRNKIERKRP